MCLRVTLGYQGTLYPFMHEADNDIRCYKVVRRCGKKYMTPYQDTKLSWPVIHGLVNFRAKGEEPEEIDIYDRTYADSGYTFLKIYDGVVHTMRFLKDAKELAEYVSHRPLWHQDDKLEIWECVIPKGSKYIQGVDSNGYPSAGSRKIRFKRKVEEL